MRFMLDTDTCSYIMRKQHPRLLQKAAAIATDDLCVSVITKGELLFGAALSSNVILNRTAITNFLGALTVLEFPDGAASHYGDIRATLRREGRTIGANDTWLAAHARFLALTLVTNNIREFSRVPALSVENWVAA